MFENPTEKNTPEVTPQVPQQQDPEVTPVVENSTPNKQGGGIKELRDSYNLLKRQGEADQDRLSRLAKHFNIANGDIDTFLTEQENAASAKTLGITPELANRLKHQEDVIAQLTRSIEERDFDARVSDLRRQYQNVTDQDIIQMSQIAGAMGIDIRNRSVNLSQIYRMTSPVAEDAYKKTIIEQYLAAEREKGNPPAINVRTGNTPAQTTPGSTTSVEGFLAHMEKAFGAK